jgi:HlyD family secretion protein
MAKQRKISRSLLTLAAAALIAASILVAFWPRAVLVDMGQVTRSNLMVLIEEEGRTRVAESYVVSTPVAGRLLRVQIHPGDAVLRGETVVAEMRPTNPVVLDVRTREQALAAVDAAQAGLRVAKADLNAAQAAEELALADLRRNQLLIANEIVSQAALDRANSAARAASANRETAEAAISLREAEVANAKAQLIDFENDGTTNGNTAQTETYPIYAPINGRVLRVLQESETILPAGAPVVEIGDISDDLEIVVELISSDAVKVDVGDAVLIKDWGGGTVLAGTVSRIDPFGITKYSALGVAEQRVNVDIELITPPADRVGLGHGYRVKAQIVVWSAENILTVPTSALFRANDGWSLFVVEDGVLQSRAVQIGQTDGISTEVIGGLTEGETVVLYPSSDLAAGNRVASRS